MLLIVTKCVSQIMRNYLRVNNSARMPTFIPGRTTVRTPQTIDRKNVCDGRSNVFQIHSYLRSRKQFFRITFPFVNSLISEKSLSMKIHLKGSHLLLLPEFNYLKQYIVQYRELLS